MRIDRRVGRLGLALLAWGCIGLSLSPGLAQTVAPPPSEDPEATLLTELVVTARLPGKTPPASTVTLPAATPALSLNVVTSLA